MPYKAPRLSASITYEHYEDSTGNRSSMDHLREDPPMDERRMRLLEAMADAGRDYRDQTQLLEKML